MVGSEELQPTRSLGVGAAGGLSTSGRACGSHPRPHGSTDRRDLAPEAAQEEECSKSGGGSQRKVCTRTEDCNTARSSTWGVLGARTAGALVSGGGNSRRASLKGHWGFDKRKGLFIQR